jgi:hypothetical protein
MLAFATRLHVISVVKDGCDQPILGGNADQAPNQGSCADVSNPGAREQIAPVFGILVDLKVDAHFSISSKTRHPEPKGSDGGFLARWRRFRTEIA